MVPLLYATQMNLVCGMGEQMHTAEVSERRRDEEGEGRRRRKEEGVWVL
jgi:hypothetical protein